jgi:hypothetical protein
MRTSEESPDIFVVKESPWATRAMLGAISAAMAWSLYENWGEMSWFVRLVMALFVALLLLIVLKFALDVTARFDRRAGRIDIARSSLFGVREESYSLTHFLRARVEESKDSDGSTYRLVLVFSEAMPAAMDPLRRLRLEQRRRRGFRRLALNEVPFTDYLSGGGQRTDESGRDDQCLGGRRAAVTFRSGYTSLSPKRSAHPGCYPRIEHCGRLRPSYRPQIPGRKR